MPVLEASGVSAARGPIQAEADDLEAEAAGLEGQAANKGVFGGADGTVWYLSYPGETVAC